MRLSERAWQIVTALSMTAGRGPLARAIADAAELTSADRVADIGCGPGTAVRHAARQGAAATGVDPDPAMLRLARWITALRRPMSAGSRAGPRSCPCPMTRQPWSGRSARLTTGRTAAPGSARLAGAGPGRAPSARRAPGQAGSARPRRPRPDP